MPDSGLREEVTRDYGLCLKERARANTVIIDDLEFFLAEAADSFELASPEEFDLFLLPLDWSEVKKYGYLFSWAVSFINRAEKLGKRVLIFCGEDSEEHLPFNHAVVVRNALSVSSRLSNEFSAPGRSEDFVKEYMGGSFRERRYLGAPVISFCGLAAPLQFIKKLMISSYRPMANFVYAKEYGQGLRAAAMYVLKKNTGIVTNFRVYNEYYAGAWVTAMPDADYIREKLREYAQNMIDSDYVLCLRGMGNWSMRFFDALSCGRMPVFVDTGSVLPFAEYSDFKKLIVWIEWKDFWRIDRILINFHKSLSAEAFLERQHECRLTWEKWFSPAAFFGNLHRYLVL